MGRHSRAVIPFVLTAAALYFSGTVAGQTGGTVRGTVTDAETGSALPNTNVYLSSTTIGTTTGPDGTYALANIPPGVFTVVASRVGHRVMSDVVRISHDETLRRDFALVPVTLQGEEVQVVARIDDEWRRRLEKFRRAFLGDWDNAPECTILNPQVLDFSMEKGTDVLVASTDSVLRIENRALGYRLYARLGIFEWDVDTDRGKFVLYPMFETLTPRDSAEMTRWRSNRIRSYRGSMKHFLASLIRGTVEQEGFIVSSGTLADLRAGAFHPLLPDDFALFPVPGQPLRKLTFENWLRVDYRGEPERSRSYIALSGGPALLDADGNLVDPLCLQVVGDWTRYRVADMLPLY